MEGGEGEDLLVNKKENVAGFASALEHGLFFDRVHSRVIVTGPHFGLQIINVRDVVTGIRRRTEMVHNADDSVRERIIGGLRNTQPEYN